MFKLRSHNSSNVCFTGSSWESLEGTPFKIVGQNDTYYVDSKGNKNYIYFIIEFENGAQLRKQHSHITAGKVKDPYYPSVCGRGYVGVGVWETSIKGVRTREYFLWKAILSRCYGHNNEETSRLYAGCTVDRRWYNFQNFCTDIQYLSGYMFWCCETNKYQLDKDLIDAEAKMYSRKTCTFLSPQANTALARRTKKIYKAYNKKLNCTKIFTYTTYFAQQYKLVPTSIISVIKGRTSSHRGWEFKIIR